MVLEGINIRELSKMLKFQGHFGGCVYCSRHNLSSYQEKLSSYQLPSLPTYQVIKKTYQVINCRRCQLIKLSREVIKLSNAVVANLSSYQEKNLKGSSRRQTRCLTGFRKYKHTTFGWIERFSSASNALSDRVSEGVSFARQTAKTVYYQHHYYHFYGR